MSHRLSKLRSQAFLNQSSRCYYCEKPVWLKDKEGFSVQHAMSTAGTARFQCTAEHLLARCDGGGDNQNNIVAACFFCNSTRHRMKSPLSPSEYKKHVQRRIRQGKWHPK
jgi:hypothetical protein